MSDEELKEISVNKYLESELVDCYQAFYANAYKDQMKKVLRKLALILIEDFGFNSNNELFSGIWEDD